ncbi:hypothetical protein FF1_010082 [Malus domestica]
MQSSFFPKTQPSFFPWLEVFFLWLSILLAQIAKSTKPSIRFSSMESNHYSPPSRFMIRELPPSASLKPTPSLRPPLSAHLNFDHHLMVSMDFDGLPDGDEIHSSDDVNEAKKRKGRGPTMLDYNALSKAKQIGVQFNDKGQHFGAGSASLSSSAWILARQLIPVTYASWDEVPTILKDKLWAAVKAISEKFKKLKSFHTLPHVMSRKGYAHLEDELRNKGTPEAKVHHMVLGPDCWKVWVTVVKVENISLYRPTSEFRVLEDVVSSTIAWPSKYVRVGE